MWLCCRNLVNHRPLDLLRYPRLLLIHACFVEIRKNIVSGLVSMTLCDLLLVSDSAVARIAPT